MLVRVEIPMEIVAEGGIDVKSIDEAVRRARRQFPSRAWQAVVRQVEKVAEKQNAGRLRRKGNRKRQLWTSAGFAEFKRQRYFYADGREKGSFMVFDLRVGLERGARFTPLEREQYAKLASVAPSYHKASEITELLLGDAPSDWAIWHRTQEAGRRLRDEDAKERRRVFQEGELPGGEIPPKPFVAVEADSTKIHKWKKKGENHEMYLGIAYDDKEKVGKNRWRVTNKVYACGVYGSKTFGEDLFVAAQKHHNVVDAETVLFLSDGDPALEAIRRNHFPQAPHQIDLRHVTEKVRSAYGWDRIEDAKQILDHIFAGDRDSFERQSIFQARCDPSEEPDDRATAFAIPGGGRRSTRRESTSGITGAGSSPIASSSARTPGCRLT